ncbi:MAG: hypothetical protein JSV51_00345 [Candidatus Bathyarchaeota archaeon]|nr:MAG: hypothetical protein JSV51_00345 [Candidatus Bathyarchaeota archaeon]
MSLMLKSKKGISPILATLLLIVIAVAAIVVTYAWVLTFTTSQTERAGEFLSVANLNWSNSSQIVVDVINSGTADSVVLRVYLGTSSTGRVEQTSVTYSPTSRIVSKDGGVIRITISYSWTSGIRYYFRVLTEAGNNWDHNERAP